MVKRQFFFHSVLCLIAIILFGALPSFAGNITLSWNAPVTNTDGTPLNNLAGYKIYYGTASHSYSQNINAGNVTTYTVTNLTDGITYYFAVTAYDTANNESGYSNEVSKTLSAQSAQQYTLNVNRAGTGAGSVTSSPAGISCSSDCSEVYNAGVSVALTASPGASSTFTGWSGACTGTAGACTVTMNGAKAVTATFTLKTYTINASAGAGGSVSPSGTVSANYGSNRSFTVTANTGYSIANVLVDGGSVGAVSSYTFSNVTTNHTISASFTRNASSTYALTVNKTGTGAGTVTSSPSGISCGAACSYAYTTGSAVTLSATSDASSTFTGWSGACTGTAGACTVTMNGAKAVTATFTLKTYTINASAGAGGTVSPSGTVSANYGSNRSFTVTANTGYSIANVLVDGGSVGTVDSYTFSNVTTNHTISASFTPNASSTYALTVNKTGTGAGTVTSSPSGISCGAACSYAYTTGSAVTLSATSDASSTFTGWSGACTGTAGACTVTMNGAKAVTATFTLKTYTINASAGAGGTVSPPGKVSVNYGSHQTFTITANTNSTIANVLIDGSSVGVADSYTFTNVARDHTISATFKNNESPQISSVFDLPKTGQTISYVPGDDGSVQAGVEWPSPRFTDDGDGTVRDNLTGLMWLKDGGCLKKKWKDALQAIANLNANPATYNCLDYSAGYSDWRLPNIKELESLVDYGESNSAHWLNASGFQNVKSNYWSSTSYQSTTAWIITMTNGIDKLSSKSMSYYMLPVRTGSTDMPYELPKTGQTASYASGDDGHLQAGNEWPSPRFTDNGDGTIKDNLTGLIWLKDGGCLNKKWDDALKAIVDLNTNPGAYNCIEYSAGYSDWRLPNIKELESLISYGTPDTSVWLNTEGFLNAASSKYWTSTTYLNKGSYTWVVNMKKGDMSYSSKKSKYRVLPVRGGSTKTDNLP